MSRKKTQNIVRLGLFVTIGAVLFILAVYLIGSNQNLFGKTFRISSTFGNVNGLQPGNNVRYSGINVGTVENISNRALERVRVEVHLSNGKELGPTTPLDLLPGAKRVVELEASGEGFEHWSAHAEVGSGEHG